MNASPSFEVDRSDLATASTVGDGDLKTSNATVLTDDTNGTPSGSGPTMNSASNEMPYETSAATISSPSPEPAPGTAAAVGAALTGGLGANQLETVYYARIASNAADMLSFASGVTVSALYALAGNDVITLSGSGSVYLGSGNDTLTMAYGAFEIGLGYGGDGQDAIKGGANGDYLYGNGGSDTLSGGGGNDTLIGDCGIQGMLPVAFCSDGLGDEPMAVPEAGAADVIDGGAGDDLIIGNEGADTLTGGSGVDWFVYEEADEFGDVITDFEAGASGDRIYFGDIFSHSVLASTPSFTSMVRFQQSGSDTLVQVDLDGSGSASGFVTAVTLKNVIAGTLQQSQIVGFSGNQSTIINYYKVASNFADTLTLSSAEATILYSLDGNDVITLSGAGTVHLGSGNDTLTMVYGSAYEIGFGYGGDGQDTIKGGANGDYLYGNGGSDTLSGGGGNDILIGDCGFEGTGTPVFCSDGIVDESTIFPEGGAADVIDGGAGDDVIVGNEGADTLTGGSGVDWFVYEDADEFGDVITDFGVGASGDRIYFGDMFSRSVFASTPSFASMVRFQQSGSDTLVQVDLDGSGSASGFVTAAILKNVVAGSILQSQIVGFPANQSTIVSSYRVGSYFADTLTFVAGAGAYSLYTLDGNDVITLSGNGGTVYLGGGNDILTMSYGASGYGYGYGGDGQDTIKGGDNRDSIYGNGGGDSISGGGGDDILIGDCGYAGLGTLSFCSDGLIEEPTVLPDPGAADVIDGGAGSDIIVGNDGADTLTGGSGVDWFVYEEASDFGDVITDFEAGVSGDRIYLGEIFAHAAFGSTPSFASVVRFQQSGADTLVQVDRDGSASAWDFVTAATLKNVTAGGIAQSQIVVGSVGIEAVNSRSVSIMATDAAKSEGQSGTTVYTFTVTRTGDASGADSVSYAVAGSGGSAASAADFVGGALPSGVVSFAIGETSKAVTVAVQGDSAVEADEAFTVTLSNPSSGLSLGLASASGTIRNDDGTVSIAATDALKAEGQSGTTVYLFTVTRTGDTSATGSVSYAVTGSGSSAASAGDFAGGVLPSGVVSFAIGETAKTVTVNVQGDSALEADDGFTVTLSTPSSGLSLGTGSASGTIRNDDGTVSIAATDTLKSEGQTGTTAYSFTVTRTGDTSGAGSVSYAVTGSGGSAASATDFAGGVLPSGIVSFATGETSKVVTVNVQGDSTVEADEGFIVTLSSPSTGLAIDGATATSTILNDDGVTAPAVVQIAALSASKPEGNAGTTAFTFTLTRSGDSSTAQTVSWSVAGSGASAADAADFAGSVLPSGSVTFAAGETSRIITVDVLGDVTVESSEGFVVALANPSAGLVIGTASATGTIVNDDALVSIAATAANGPEGNAGTTAFTFTLTRSGDTSVAQSVSWSVTGSGANAANAADFAGGVLPSGSVTFAAGETSRIVAVDVLGDVTVESSEGFVVALANPSAGLVIGTASATGTIVNDDALVSIAATVATKPEGNGGTSAFTFTLTRSGDTSVAQSVSWSVMGAGANAANAADFAGGVAPSGSVTFAAGESAKIVSIGVQGDTNPELNEGFSVTLASPSPGLAIAVGVANGTIQDDDARPLMSHDDAFVSQQGKTMVVAAGAGVLSNDESGGPLTASLKTTTSHGAVQLASDGGFTYTPLFGFAGIDTFSYYASNGASTVDGQAVLYVVPVSAGTTTTLSLVALTAEEQIAATYAAFFGRAADAGGLKFWVNEFNTGLPTQGPAKLFANIASSFGVSNEAKSLYPFLANPFEASDGQISAFLESVYNNLFNRSSDAGGLAYWTDQIKHTLQSGQFVGSILVDIMSGAQDTAGSKDITTLMSKVAVSLEYVHEQEQHHTVWAGASDTAAATALLHAVTADPLTLLAGIKNAEVLIAAHP